MSYLKAITVGLVAAVFSIFAIVACVAARMFWIIRNTPPPEGGAWAVDCVLAFKSVPYRWLIVSFCLAVGFLWEVRRASRSNGSNK